MSPTALEDILRELPTVGVLVKDRGYRQVWRFEAEGRGYFVKFYPRRYHRLKRLFRGNPALWEFMRLQALQKAQVPAPRAVAHLVGFKLHRRLGDAVVLEELQDAVPLDHYVNALLIQAKPIPDRRKLFDKVCDLLAKLGQARLGHNDLHLGNLVLKDGEVYLIDAYAVRFGGLRMMDVMTLAHSVRGLITRTEVLRGWLRLGPGGLPPAANLASPRLWRKFVERSRQDNPYFGLWRTGAWRGVFFKQSKFPRRWAPASYLSVRAEDWEAAWPRLWEQIESGQLQPLKRGPSGDVWAGEVVLGGKTVPIVVKRPYRRYWYRYLNEIGRGSRAWRAWHKAWSLVARGIPTAWPLLVLQKRKLGYITDAVIVFEQVQGPTLARIDLDSLPESKRNTLLQRTGAVLRWIDQIGLGHFDAKSSNWIVQDDPVLGPRPILIDVDGIRFRRWQALGIERLLRSMEQHKQYTPEDSLALCRGYAPFSPQLVVPSQ